MHPHPNPQHVVSQYRKHILSCKRKFGSARSLIHYRQIVAAYLECKRAALSREPKETGACLFGSAPTAK